MAQAPEPSPMQLAQAVEPPELLGGVTLGEAKSWAEAQAGREDSDASPEDLQARLASGEDLRCFVTFAGPEDGEPLGLGLYVHAPTRQQLRGNLPPDFDLTGDYLCAEAFNEGLARAVAAAPWRPRRCARWPEVEPPCMVSSARGRLNGWLPLYINAKHWSEARRYAPAAFAQLSRARRGLLRGPRPRPESFRARDALDVCCGVMTSAIVGFVHWQSGDAWDERAAARGKASERALQLVADVHRLLLQLAAEHPEVRSLAEQRLRNFLTEPQYRTRERTPSLGHLVLCLLVVEDLAWEELAPVLVPEALRRHALRQQRRGEGAFRPPRRPAGELEAAGPEGVVEAWDGYAPRVGLVLSFQVAFLRLVGRPRGLALAEVAAAYDRRWGRLPSAQVEALMAACAALTKRPTVLDLVAAMGPAPAAAAEAAAERPAPLLAKAAELALWAGEHGRTQHGEDSEPIPQAAWPALGGAAEAAEALPMLRRWLGGGRAGGGRRRTRKSAAWRLGSDSAEHQQVPTSPPGSWTYPASNIRSSWPSWQPQWPHRW